MSATGTTQKIPDWGSKQHYYKLQVFPIWEGWTWVPCWQTLQSWTWWACSWKPMECVSVLLKTSSDSLVPSMQSNSPMKCSVSIWYQENLQKFKGKVYQLKVTYLEIWAKQSIWAVKLQWWNKDTICPMKRNINSKNTPVMKNCATLISVCNLEMYL